MWGEGKTLLNNIKNFRKWVLNEAVSSGRIADAINAHEVLYIYYKGDDTVAAGYRTIKPFVLGKYSRTKTVGKGKNKRTEPIDNNGKDVLRAWQDAGSSDSFRRQDGVKPRAGHEKFSGPHGLQPGWRLFFLENITSVQPTGVRFHPEKYYSVEGVQYNPNDKEMTGIVASIGLDAKKQDKYIAAAQQATRDITREEVIELLKIARKHRKEAYRKFWVVELENGAMVLKTETALRRQKIPQAAIVGNLKDLYNEFVAEKGRGTQDKFFDDQRKDAEN